jgi:hypothetical protein
LHDGQGPLIARDFASFQSSREAPMLLRLVSKREVDFNEISTDFSTPKTAISSLEMREKPPSNFPKN